MIYPETKTMKNSVLLKQKKEGQNPFIEYVRDRPRKNKNFLVAWVGQTGSGKTYSAISFAKAVDPRFTVNDIVFTIQDFFKRLREYQIMWSINPRKVKGRVIIFDEAGVGMNNRQWQSYSNKATNAVMQSFRYMNLIVIFTTPDFGYIDIGSRKLFHGYFEAENIDYKRQLAYSKYKLFRRDHLTGDAYPMYPRILCEDGCSRRLTRIAVKKAPDELLKAYEFKRHTWASKKYETLEEGIIANDAGSKVIMGSDGMPQIQETTRVGKKSADVDLVLLKNTFIQEPALFMKQSKQGEIRIDPNLLKGHKDFSSINEKSLRLAVKKLYFDADVQEIFKRVRDGDMPLMNF